MKLADLPRPAFKRIEPAIKVPTDDITKIGQRYSQDGHNYVYVLFGPCDVCDPDIDCQWCEFNQ